MRISRWVWTRSQNSYVFLHLERAAVRVTLHCLQCNRGLAVRATALVPSHQSSPAEHACLHDHTCESKQLRYRVLFSWILRGSVTTHEQISTKILKPRSKRCVSSCFGFHRHVLLGLLGVCARPHHKLAGVGSKSHLSASSTDSFIICFSCCFLSATWTNSPPPAKIRHIWWLSPGCPSRRLPILSSSNTCPRLVGCTQPSWATARALGRFLGGCSWTWTPSHPSRSPALPCSCMSRKGPCAYCSLRMFEYASASPRSSSCPCWPWTSRVFSRRVRRLSLPLPLLQRCAIITWKCWHPTPPTPPKCCCFQHSASLSLSSRSMTHVAYHFDITGVSCCFVFTVSRDGSVVAPRFLQQLHTKRMTSAGTSVLWVQHLPRRRRQKERKTPRQRFGASFPQLLRKLLNTGETRVTSLILASDKKLKPPQHSTGFSTLCSTQTAQYCPGKILEIWQADKLPSSPSLDPVLKGITLAPSPTVLSTAARAVRVHVQSAPLYKVTFGLRLKSWSPRKHRWLPSRKNIGTTTNCSIICGTSDTGTCVRDGICVDPPLCRGTSQDI